MGTMIPLGANLVMVGGVFFYAHKQIGNLRADIAFLEEKIKRMEAVIDNQGQLLLQLRGGMQVTQPKRQVQKPKPKPKPAEPVCDEEVCDLPDTDEEPDPEELDKEIEESEALESQKTSVETQD